MCILVVADPLGRGFLLSLTELRDLDELRRMYPDCPINQEELLSHHCLKGWDPKDRLNLVVDIRRYMTTICRHHAGLPDGHPCAIGVSRGKHGWVCWLQILEQIQKKYGLHTP